MQNVSMAQSGLIEHDSVTQPNSGLLADAEQSQFTDTGLWGKESTVFLAGHPVRRMVLVLKRPESRMAFREGVFKTV